LEDHLNQAKEDNESDVEMSDEEADKKAWKGWDVESDDSSDEDSEDGWMNVDSEGDDQFDVSDSEDEKTKSALLKPVEETVETPKEEETKRTSTLATTKVCFVSVC
jgi:protein SDA1